MNLTFCQNVREVGKMDKRNKILLENKENKNNNYVTHIFHIDIYDGNT
jgi:hypothetical protein